MATILSGWWLWHTFAGGRLVASARLGEYFATVRERPIRGGQFFLPIGTQIYQCDIYYRGIPFTAWTFNYAGSFRASRVTIKIHESHPDDRYDGFVQFDIDGYPSRCDFAVWKRSDWTWQHSQQ